MSSIFYLFLGAVNCAPADAWTVARLWKLDFAGKLVVNISLAEHRSEPFFRFFDVCASCFTRSQDLST